MGSPFHTLRGCYAPTRPAGCSRAARVVRVRESDFTIARLQWWYEHGIEHALLALTGDDGLPDHIESRSTSRRQWELSPRCRPVVGFSIEGDLCAALEFMEAAESREFAKRAICSLCFGHESTEREALAERVEKFRVAIVR